MRNIDRRELGERAEVRAVALLEQAGFDVLARNYHCRGGELDIIARRGSLLLIAEVRLRSRQDFGGAAASITLAKRRRIIRTTRLLLRRCPALEGLYVRFDVLLLERPDGPIEWIRSAFDAA